MKNFRPKDVPVRSSFLTIISQIGSTHLQRVSPSLGESLWQTGPPYSPILKYGTFVLKFPGVPGLPNFLFQLQSQVLSRTTVQDPP